VMPTQVNVRMIAMIRARTALPLASGGPGNDGSPAGGGGGNPGGGEACQEKPGTPGGPLPGWCGGGEAVRSPQGLPGPGHWLFMDSALSSVQVLHMAERRLR